MPDSTNSNPLVDPGFAEVFKEWEPKGLKPKHLVMCEYHMAGMNNREIARRLQMHEVTVGLVLRSDLAREYCAGRVDDLNHQLHGQFRHVVDNLEAALTADSIDTRLKATDMWFRAHGRYSQKEDKRGGPVSAEAVVQELLERAKFVQVNIDNRRVETKRPADDFSFLERTE